jgi:hypothetical protein
MYWKMPDKTGYVRKFRCYQVVQPGTDMRVNHVHPFDATVAKRVFENQEKRCAGGLRDMQEQEWLRR